MPGYDYWQPGAYFVTFVTHGRECILGKIVDEGMQLSPAGRMVQDSWLNLLRHFPHVRLGPNCIMPNHVHAIIILMEDECRGGSINQNDNWQVTKHDPLRDMANRAGRALHSIPTSQKPHRRHALAEIVRAWKSYSAQRINQLHKETGTPVWQRNYFEHIIRSGEEYERIGWYIDSNPENWENDEENVMG